MVLLVNALAYLLPAHADGSFGTEPQCLAAFAAGAGGQVVIAGTLIPLTRSYRRAAETKRAAVS